MYFRVPSENFKVSDVKQCVGKLSPFHTQYFTNYLPFIYTSDIKGLLTKTLKSILNIFSMDIVNTLYVPITG